MCQGTKFKLDVEILTYTFKIDDKLSYNMEKNVKNENGIVIII